MSATKNSENAKTIKDLADGFNIQSLYSNQLWLVLIVASAVIAFPQENAVGNVELPFSFGSVPISNFNTVGDLRP